MKSLVKEIKEWKHGALKYLKYSWKLTIWLYINRGHRCILSLKKHFGLIRRLSLIVAAIVAALIANYYGAISFSSDTLSSYLTTVGTMIGGTIAIIFSISIFLLQGVADLYSSKHFEEYTNNWKDQLIYIIVIIIMLGFLTGGLMVGRFAGVSEVASADIVFASLVLISIVFALIDLQYQLVRKKISPLNAILFLENKGQRFLKALQKNAMKIAELISLRQALSNEIALAAAYNHVLQPFINDLDRQLETLAEVAMKLFDRNEIETTKRAFTAINNLLVGFFEARKTSSLAIPSSTAFLSIQSDSQTFLSKNFERFNKAGEKFILERRDENASHIIDIYNALAAKAQEITFVSGHNENPILDNLVGYLGFFIENGKRAKNIEVVYQGTRVLGNIALIAAQKGYSTTLYGIQESLLQLAIFGVTEKYTIVVDLAVSNFLKIIEAVFMSDTVVARHQFDKALKHIATITNYEHVAVKLGHLSDDFTTRMSMSKGYDELYTSIAKIVNRYFKLTDEREKRSYRSDLTNLFEQINMSLRSLSEKIKECDSVLVDSVGRLLFHVNYLIIELYQKEEFKDQKAEFLRRLDWNIHLPSWFAHHAEKIDASSNPYKTLTDSIAKTGIFLAQELGKESKEQIKDCVDALFSMTKHALEKGIPSYGYAEPRVLEKACYLGILALKNGWDDIFTEVGLKIYEFEPIYFKKYFTNLPPGIDPEDHNVIGLPRRNQLFIELFRWRDRFEYERLNGMLRIRDDAEAIMYSLVRPIDIDRFMFEVWGSFPADSEIEAEIEEKFKRKIELKKLVNLLKYRALN